MQVKIVNTFPPLQIQFKTKFLQFTCLYIKNQSPCNFDSYPGIIVLNFELKLEILD